MRTRCDALEAARQAMQLELQTTGGGYMSPTSPVHRGGGMVPSRGVHSPVWADQQPAASMNGGLSPSSLYGRSTTPGGGVPPPEAWAESLMRQGSAPMLRDPVGGFSPPLRGSPYQVSAAGAPVLRPFSSDPLSPGMHSSSPVRRTPRTSSPAGVPFRNHDPLGGSQAMAESSWRSHSAPRVGNMDDSTRRYPPVSRMASQKNGSGLLDYYMPRPDGLASSYPSRGSPI